MKFKSNLSSEQKKVIIGSCTGTIFEWYDFYLYGALATIIAKQFFSYLNPSSAFIFALLAFSSGFIVRPIGAIFFGYFGDKYGRKKTFLATVIIMGLATFLVGLLPNYESIGFAAPLSLITLRILQGFAVGGEYGGAATYVAENVANQSRGFFTAWIQITSSAGLFIALLIILITRTYLGEEKFELWGWRIPFLISVILLCISVYIRQKMSESAVFNQIKKQGKLSKAPLKEAFMKWNNLKFVLIALFGLIIGPGVIWHTGHLYSLFFLTQILKVEPIIANSLLLIGLFFMAPFFIFFGHLSDIVGRKKIILTGCVLAVISYIPTFKILTYAINPDLAYAQKHSTIFLETNKKNCSLMFNLTGTKIYITSCDIAKQALSNRAANYTFINNPHLNDTIISIGKNQRLTINNINLNQNYQSQIISINSQLKDELIKAGYPEKNDPKKMNLPLALLVIMYLILLATMAFGPLAATLVELFPTRIRYSSMSLPFHLGNGWFGGLLPAVSFMIIAQTGNIYLGLFYPITLALISTIVGGIFLPETKDRNINE